MFTSIQLILLAIIIFALSRVILRAREKMISPRLAIFWVLIWVAALVGILAPATTTRIASLFGVGRGVDVIVYISLTLLFYLVFRVYVAIEDIRHQITFLIRQIALQNSSKKPSPLSSSHKRGSKQ